jgi:hypothetical protein
VHAIKLGAIVMVATNLVILGLQASKPPQPPSAPDEAVEQAHEELPSIRLLSELDELAPEVASQSCFTVGPFESSETAAAISELIAEQAAGVATRQTEAFVDRGYWVYLPPFESARAGRRAVEALLEAGLEDIALIRQGRWNRAVSLGYYIEQSNAVRRRQQVRALGMDAQMIVRRDDEVRYWVDYVQGLGAGYASRVLDGLVPPGLHHQTACEDPAAGPLARFSG